MPLADILTRLKQYGYKATPQRLAVVKAIGQSEEHLTPMALYHKVRQEHPQIGLVTVYRTLSILTELGLICEVRTGEKMRSYVCRPAEHHDHLICSGCGKVVNFTDCNVAELAQRLTSETGFAIEEHHLEFLGHCRDCRG